MAREKHDIPTGRVRRGAKIGRLAAGQTVKQMGTRAANLTRDDEKKAAAIEKRQIEAAEQIVEVLGTMKGAAMKLGQVLSFLDVGLVPEDHREEFQKKLAKLLRDAAPKVSFKDMRKVIEEDMGEQAQGVLREFDEEPIAAASIGQVYRATLHDGPRRRREGAVPGRQRRGALGHAEPRGDPAADAAHDARPRHAVAWPRRSARASHEELDYELEADNQRPLARLFRGHPFIVVPDVVTDLSHERVIVTEFVEGKRLRGAQGRAPGGARPRRRDHLPLLLRLPVPPPAVLRRPAPRQLPPDARRPRGVPRLRAVQDDLAGGRRPRARVPARGGARAADEELHRAAGGAVGLPQRAREARPRAT